MASIIQDMRFRLALIKYAEKYGVSKAAARYKTNRLEDEFTLIYIDCLFLALFQRSDDRNHDCRYNAGGKAGIIKIHSPVQNSDA